MKVMGFDVSSKTGWCVFEDNTLKDFGLLKVEIQNFNVNKEPSKEKEYPGNILKAADQMATLIYGKILDSRPDLVVIENTVKGRNRHTQRLLEWIHKSLMDYMIESKYKFKYVDPSEWRSKLNIRMSKDDKKNNRDVSSGKKRGRITRKHLSVRWVNENFKLNLKLKDNDIADCIALGASQL